MRRDSRRVERSLHIAAAGCVIARAKNTEMYDTRRVTVNKRLGDCGPRAQYRCTSYKYLTRHIGTSHELNLKDSHQIILLLHASRHFIQSSRYTQLIRNDRYDSYIIIKYYVQVETLSKSIIGVIHQ
ncbi:hypothetical protein PYW08_016174 [Mythimna loreyi]|uniref:Uncharacterized protein n=1 Tax=Mythimna loreyi TaxID=667449 RepID=A0ACC2QSZ1_9NEOP|nr:hypothetical protein PYW08_016174 [Mythimna loreyi]